MESEKQVVVESSLSRQLVESAREQKILFLERRRREDDED